VGASTCLKRRESNVIVPFVHTPKISPKDFKVTSILVYLLKGPPFPKVTESISNEVRVAEFLQDGYLYAAPYLMPESSLR
jgi:hypothetical protein